MKRLGTIRALMVGVGIWAGHARCGEAGPDFREVYEVLRTNLAGATDAELNEAAVTGLFYELRGRASLVDDSVPSKPALSKFTVVERSVGVARVKQLHSRLAAELATEFRAAAATNKLKGLVLDLRFVSGDDYAAVAAVAELFVGKDRDLLDWGNGPVKSSADTAAIEFPLAVLVNRETIGAPEALAGVLRELGVGLIFGNSTAGRAFAGREISLSSGHKLRVAATPVKLADGSEIPASGLKPDILVPVTPEQEKLLVIEPYGPALTVASTTNAPTSRPARSRRPSEADLVRERREITNQPAVGQPGETMEKAPEKPVILDPVLARAVDLLKGLAVVRGTRP